MASDKLNDTNLEDGLLTVASDEKRTLMTNTPTSPSTQTPRPNRMARACRLTATFAVCLFIGYGLTSAVVPSMRCTGHHAHGAAAGQPLMSESRMELSQQVAKAVKAAEPESLHRLVEAYIHEEAKEGESVQEDLSTARARLARRQDNLTSDIPANPSASAGSPSAAPSGPASQPTTSGSPTPSVQPSSPTQDPVPSTPTTSGTPSVPSTTPAPAPSTQPQTTTTTSSQPAPSPSSAAVSTTTQPVPSSSTSTTVTSAAAPTSDSGTSTSQEPPETPSTSSTAPVTTSTTSLTSILSSQSSSTTRRTTTTADETTTRGETTTSTTRRPTSSSAVVTTRTSTEADGDITLVTETSYVGVDPTPQATSDSNSDDADLQNAAPRMSSSALALFAALAAGMMLL
ncbi:hypothetical protein D7B24_007415 [Verticillium nonalfalfae]|uniref:Uncharacterized protein n=1 Tax=Verticillium nonalfalfae TaxID=1051616 RepID=A0A3M9YKK9_9PEZI|nr:uncharacterized protein D7B24_007415 [Verticillium nonalfalfae]RNJ60492.1 hypothetical protein D7B24_007415 [Verticillium nonalfalfae]